MDQESGVYEIESEDDFVKMARRTGLEELTFEHTHDAVELVFDPEDFIGYRAVAGRGAFRLHPSDECPHCRSFNYNLQWSPMGDGRPVWRCDRCKLIRPAWDKHPDD